MSLDGSIVAIAVRYPARLTDLQRAGVTADDFVEEFQPVWRFLTRTKSKHGTVPSRAAVETRFAEIDLPRGASPRDLPELLDQLNQRKKWTGFTDALYRGADMASSPEDVDAAIAQVQTDILNLSSRNGNQHLIDLLGEEGRKRMLRDIRSRAKGKRLGIPTGLTRFDSIAGGLQAQRLVTIMGRTSIGKSWIDLLFTAQAVLYGKKVILYPLEMTLEETALRLYTIFSFLISKKNRSIRNTDLLHGRVSKQKIVKFLHVLEDRFAGQLLVADIGSISDPYTASRVGAEVELEGCDLFWIDYITLMSTETTKDEKEHAAIGRLTKALTHIAIREHCVAGISAQVNREALRSNIFLPRLEHIADADVIGRDAHQAFSINRRGDWLWYALVKNRHGPEIGPTRVKFNVDYGEISETEGQGEDDED